MNILLIILIIIISIIILFLYSSLVLASRIDKETESEIRLHKSL